MSNVAVPFPKQLPPGFEWLQDEPEFDAAAHLQLELPASHVTLADLGYSDEEISETCTPFAASSPFRVLSEQGAAIMLDVSRRLNDFKVTSDRIENLVRGGCYRSRWLRDLCTSPELTDHMSQVYGVPVAHHTMPSHLGHLNFAPSELSQAVDKWHHDTLALDFVMMVADPALLDGGDFEYFFGTKTEAAALAAAGETPPLDRRVAFDWPGPGYAVGLHGNMVVHRGAPLRQVGERITMVNGYVPMATTQPDQSRHPDLLTVDAPDELYASWTKHVAWRARERLDTVIAEIEFGTDAAGAMDALQNAIVDVTTALEEMQIENPQLMHYGG